MQIVFGLNVSCRKERKKHQFLNCPSSLPITVTLEWGLRSEGDPGGWGGYVEVSMTSQSSSGYPSSLPNNLPSNFPPPAHVVSQFAVISLSLVISPSLTHTHSWSTVVSRLSGSSEKEAELSTHKHAGSERDRINLLFVLSLICCVAAQN